MSETDAEFLEEIARRVTDTVSIDRLHAIANRIKKEEEEKKQEAEGDAKVADAKVKSPPPSSGADDHTTASDRKISR